MRQDAQLAGSDAQPARSRRREFQDWCERLFESAIPQFARETELRVYGDWASMSTWKAANGEHRVIVWANAGEAWVLVDGKLIGLYSKSQFQEASRDLAVAVRDAIRREK